LCEVGNFAPPRYLLPQRRKSNENLWQKTPVRKVNLLGQDFFSLLIQARKRIVQKAKMNFLNVFNFE